MVCNATYFSADYFAARTAFRAAVERSGGSWQAVPIAARGPNDEDLTIDVASLGEPQAERLVIVSSGLHGVEGFFGSAAQTAWLAEGSQTTPPAGTRLLFLHALNPFGFAWRRRWNEHNVDLNRNFLLPGEPFAGSPPLYARLDSLLNPRSPPSRWEPFLLKAAAAMLRYGASRLAQSLPVGQYDYPQGLFFGGSELEETNRILAEYMAGWLGIAREVLHIDLHTALGKFGTYQLLLDAPPNSPRVRSLARQFDAENVSANRLAEGAGKSGVIYASRGTWEKWCLATFADRTYNFATAEFGTYSGPRVIAALRAENRAYHFTGKNDAAYEWTRAAVVEAFAPRSLAWREQVVKQGIEIIDRAVGDES